MWKKIIASVLTIALVFTAFNYVPQTIEAGQADASAYDWSTVEYLKTSGDTTSFADLYKMKLIEGNANIDVIQNPGFATAPGIYTTFSDADFGEITVNDKVTTAYSVQGAGMIFHMEGFTEKYNELIVKNSAGAVKAKFYVYYENGTGGTTVDPGTDPTEPVSGVLAPTDVTVYNFYAQNKGYQINFTASEGAVSYNVYIDNNTTAIANITATGEYLATDVFSAYADDELHKIYLTAVDADGKVSAKSTAANVRITTLTNSDADPSDVTRIYVVTNAGTKGGANITKAAKTEASLTIISGDDAISTQADGGTIKRRGNSTSLADKPAYNISFNSKKAVFKNAKKGKKWCLLANAYEKTLMRNKLAMDFGAKLGNIGVPEEHYADLYIDGILQGSYVISEPAENGHSGVDYNDDATSDELLFELEDNDKNEDECLYYTTSTTGTRFVTEETLDTTSSRYQKWVSTMEAFEKALVNTSSDEVFQYMDVDTFVDMYIVNELFQTVDFGYSSVKFYITYDATTGAPTIHAGPLWDFDLSSGNSSFAENRTYDTMRGQNVNKWFKYLMQNNTFKSKVVKKFEEYQPVIQNIYKDNQLGISQIQQNCNEMEQSRIRNYTAKSEGGAGWNESTADSAEYSIYPYSYSTVAPYSTYTYDQHISYLSTWLENRDKWLCTQWGIDYDKAGNASMTSSDIAITGYQMSTSLNGIDGEIGCRVIYQAEPMVDGQEVSEIGLIYGLVYGDNPITESDMVYGSDNKYVTAYAATDTGKLNVKMGESSTASYYVMTMESCEGVAALTSQYYVRTYAKLADGTISYSDVKSYTVFNIADRLYQNKLVNRKSTFDYLYSKVLSVVDSNYKTIDFDWSNTLVK